MRFRKLLALGNCLPHVDADKLEDLVRLLPLPKTYLGTLLPHFGSYSLVYTIAVIWYMDAILQGINKTTLNQIWTQLKLDNNDLASVSQGQGCGLSDVRSAVVLALFGWQHW